MSSSVTDFLGQKRIICRSSGRAAMAEMALVVGVLSCVLASTASPSLSPGTKAPSASPITCGQTCAREAQALQSLYESTGGPTWTRKNNWLSGCPCPGDNWEGVQCFNCQVTQLNLMGNNLSGTLPEGVWSNLTALTHLYAERNSISGILKLVVLWRLIRSFFLKVSRALSRCQKAEAECE